MNTLLVCLLIINSLFIHVDVSAKLGRNMLDKLKEYLKEIVKSGIVSSLSEEETLKLAKSIYKSIIATYIPIVNIFVSFTFPKKIKRVLKNPKSEKVYISKNDQERMLAMDDVISITGDLIDIINGIINLTYDKQLVPMAYKIDEIEKISNELDLGYILMKINGINTAIFSDDIEEKRNVFLDGKEVSIDILDFENINNITFKVYLETNDENMRKKADAIVDGLSEERRRKNKASWNNSNDVTFLQTKEKKLSKVIR